MNERVSLREEVDNPFIEVLPPQSPPENALKHCFPFSEDSAKP